MKSNKLNIVSSILFLVISLCSFGQNFDWVKEVGSTGWDEGRSIGVDNQGNVYTTGHFKGTVDFDPGIGVFNLSSVDEEDAFIFKLNASGDFIWAKQFGDSSFVECNDLVLDSDGNIYITGSFLGPIDFDPNSGISEMVSTYGGRDIFIQKIDGNGNLMWAKQISGYTPLALSNPSPTNAFSIAINSNDDIYITGYFDGTVDFDPDTIATNYLTVIQASDIFISKYDSDGNFDFVKQLGGTLGAVAYSIEVDENNNIYTTGVIGGTVDFDPGAGTYNLVPTSIFEAEMFISKLDSLGDFVWANKLGAGAGYAITSDNNGNVYSTGEVSSNSTILNKHDFQGNLIWAKDIGGLYGKSIAIDNNGNVFTTGYAFGTNDFDPALSVFNLTGDGVFISKLDSFGNFNWAGLLISTNQITPNAIVSDINNDIYLTGFYNGTTDFDPSIAVFNLTAPLIGYNAFVYKLDSEIGLGIAEISNVNEIKVYPNPTKGNIFIELGKEQEDINVSIKNALGQEVKSEMKINHNHAEIQFNGAPGIYFLELSYKDTQTEVFQIIKE